MKILTVPDAQQTILRRRAWDEIDVPARLLDGIEAIFGERITPDEVVRRILADVRETAENLRRYGGFLPGIRPGKNTADYLDYVLTRLTAVGALYLAGVSYPEDPFG